MKTVYPGFVLIPSIVSAPTPSRAQDRLMLPGSRATLPPGGREHLFLEKVKAFISPTPFTPMFHGPFLLTEGQTFL